MKIKLLIAGAALSAVTLMTGCHTVAGTVEGAATGVQRDVNTVANAADVQPTPVRHATYHHRKHHRHHTTVARKSKTSSVTTQTTTTGAATDGAAAAAPATAEDPNQTAQ